MGGRTSQSLFKQYLRAISLALNTKMFQIQKVRGKDNCGALIVLQIQKVRGKDLCGALIKRIKKSLLPAKSFLEKTPTLGALKGEPRRPFRIDGMKNLFAY